MQTRKIPIIIDMDPGIDDAVALMLALASPKLDILLVSTVFGNVDVEQTSKNALDLLNLIKKSHIPVVAGENLPLKGEKLTLSVHGYDGIGGFSEKFPKHNNKLVDGNAHEKMAQVIMASKEPVTILACGPMTNIAKLLLLHPEVKQNIERIVLSAGSIEKYAPGELPYFGFNAMADPNACETVLNSGICVEVCPSDMGHLAYLNYFEVYQTKNTNSMGEIWEQIFRVYKDRHIKTGIAMHDSCAVVFVSNPEIFKVEKLHVHVGYFGENKTGVLRCEWEEPRNIFCATDIDVKRFKEIYFRALRKTKTIYD